MRSSAALTLALCFACIGPAQAAGSDREAARAREKSIMNRGSHPPVVAGRGASDTITGTLELSSPTWDRIFTNDVDANLCLADSQASGIGEGVPYAAFEIQVTAEEDLEAHIALLGTTINDTVLALYCDPFDPGAPGVNLVAYDDDGAGDLHGAFTTIDQITLEPGSTYWIVVSTFEQGDFGEFRLELTSATVRVVPVELQSFTVE